MTGLWFFTIVIGPILLLSAIIYATMRYRNRDRSLDPLSDRKAAELREQLNAEDTGAAPRRD
jgi:hypothetical protein